MTDTAEALDPLAIEIGLLSHDPLGFVTFAFPWGKSGTVLEHEAGPREWQAAVLEKIGAALRAGASVDGAIRMAVASGHGIGKSALVAWIILWALATFPRTRIVVTANTEGQLRTKTWPEISKWHYLSICRHWFRLDATSISAMDPEMAKTWRCDALPWSEHNAVAFAGLHNKGCRIVLLFDEASEIADPIWETAEGALTDEDTEILWLAFGNPTINTGRFRECFAGGRFAHRWDTAQIDSRTVPGANTAEIAKWAQDYGDDSDFFRIRVKGQFPRGGSMQFIDSETVEAATRREAVSSWRQPLIIGVDVARFGDDQSVIYFRRGLDARTVPPLKFRGLDTVDLAGKVVEQAMAHNAQAIFIDETGVGAGVVDMVRKWMPELLVIGINNGGKANRYTMGSDMPSSANKGAEMWASMREWLKTGSSPTTPSWSPSSPAGSTASTSTTRSSWSAKRT